MQVYLDWPVISQSAFVTEVKGEAHRRLTILSDLNLKLEVAGKEGVDFRQWEESRPSS